MTTIGSRNNVPYVGSNISPSTTYVPTPSYGYDQRNYGYPNTAHIQSNTSPYQQAYAPNYGYGQRNYDPSYEPNYGYGSTNYNFPSRSNISPNNGYNQGNHGYQGSPHQMHQPNHAYGPSVQGYPGESHIQSSQGYDQRNYGYSSASRHDSNFQPGEIY